MAARDPFGKNPLVTRGEIGSGLPRRRSLAISITLHALFTVGLIVIPAKILGQAEEPEKIDIVFFAPPEMEPPPIAPPEPRPEPEPEPQVEIAKVSEPLPSPKPPVEIEPPQPEPQPAPVVTRVEPPRPKIRTDVLPEPAPVKKTPPKRIAHTGSFARAETAPAQPQSNDREVAREAAFETSAAAAAPPGRENTRVVAAGRFAGGEVRVPRAGAPARAGSVSRTGFEVTETASSAPKAGGTVKRGGFGDDVAEARPRVRKAPTAEADTPVDIISKPKPVYTEKARERRIEGEVVLEVTFIASGELRVLRVLDGLGYGLDEAAIEAAEKIRFKPARRGGRAVDHTATLRVVFRLA